jgi:phenylpropionate dioxygenase-like ring-hydroxylating dioxygenase large terminal subunit
MMLDAPERTQTAMPEQPTGTAYGRPQAHPNAEWTQVGPQTPGGEYLRRYWHPVALSADVGQRPKKVKVLGEDLILFRDGQGRAGLLYPRCMHRGTSLFFGHVESDGLRCCYHGWKFDVQGHCLDQPCEPERGLRRDTARQPWYPVQELYGLVFAYLGPPDRIPVLPRYDILENLEEGEILSVLGGGALQYGDTKLQVEVTPYNWLQAWENMMDPFHVWVLHSTFSEIQFADGFKVRPKVEFERSDTGAVYHAYRDFPDGRSMDRTSHAILPNIGSVPPVDMSEGRSTSMIWWVPVDDESFVMFVIQKGREAMTEFTIPMTPDGRGWSQMSEAEHQDYPGDFEAQWGQGTITKHSEEHLAQSDIGIVMLRRLMQQQINAVKGGAVPAGVTFDPKDEVVHIVSGNFFR